ncbi:MAG: OmpA family protein [Nitrospirae bacterium]|nr:OmpA family protein [Nitrospirota bacterium]
MKGQSIIIKKVKKAAHGGAHGGSWKVAYADFVTAMMAFFLLMWLISMTSPESKVALAAYYQGLSVLDAAGLSFLGRGSDVVQTIAQSSKPSDENNKGGGNSAQTKDEKEKLKEKIKKEVEAKLADIKDQVLVDVIKGGIRIQILDKNQKPMFSIGSSELMPDARGVLQIVSENIKSIKNARISIEGHTDTLNYYTNKYTNWELSTDRASAARRELQRYGINPDNIAEVSGLAATDPLIKADPADPRNRRISIVVLTEITAKPDDTLPMTGAVPAPPVAEKKAETIKPGIVKINPLSE